MRKRLHRLPSKMKGKLKGNHAPRSMKFAIWGLISGSLSIFAILEVTKMTGHPLLIGSFGASAVLLFGANDSPLAQPRNLVLGHLLSATVAVAMVALFGSGTLSMSVAVGLSIFLMYVTRSIHPPGGATALIGVQGHAGIGFLFVPVMAGVLILLTVALFTNNIVHHRQYPKHWI